MAGSSLDTAPPAHRTGVGKGLSTDGLLRHPNPLSPSGNHVAFRQRFRSPTNARICFDAPETPA